jgi:hypothetical protein
LESLTIENGKGNLKAGGIDVKIIEVDVLPKTILPTSLR